MDRVNYEFGTNPKKLEPSYKPNKTRKKDYEKQLKINEEQRKDALKMEKRRQNINVGYVVAIFLVLLTISYRSSLINERFSELQTSKEKLAAIEKTNGQLEVNIESSLNLSNIEQSAKEKLGMQKLDNSQKVFVTLDKKDYVESSAQNINSSEKENRGGLKQFFKKLFAK